MAAIILYQFYGKTNICVSGSPMINLVWHSVKKVMKLKPTIRNFKHLHINTSPDVDLIVLFIKQIFWRGLPSKEWWSLTKPLTIYPTP